MKRKNVGLCFFLALFPLLVFWFGFYFIAHYIHNFVVHFSFFFLLAPLATDFIVWIFATTTLLTDFNFINLYIPYCKLSSLSILCLIFIKRYFPKSQFAWLCVKAFFQMYPTFKLLHYNQIFIFLKMCLHVIFNDCIIFWLADEPHFSSIFHVLRAVASSFLILMINPMWVKD